MCVDQENRRLQPLDEVKESRKRALSFCLIEFFQHLPRWILLCESLRPQAGASRARSGERDASKGIFVHIAPLDPAYKARAGLTGRVPAKSYRKMIQWIGFHTMSGEEG